VRDRPYLSVIVPCHNAAGDLPTFLAHIAASRFSDFECLLIDDGSAEHPGAIVDKATLPVRVFRNSARLGPAAARNLGAHQATGEILVFLDADVCVHTGTLGQIAVRFRQDPDLGAVFGSYDDSPTVRALISQFRNLLHCYTHQASPRKVHTFWAGCGGIRRQIFLDHGGFSERYRHPSIEDIEFGSRLSAAGVAIELDREIQVRHRKTWTLGSMCRTDILRRGIPWTRLVLEQRKMPSQLSLRHGQRFSVLLTWAALAALPGIAGHKLFSIVLVLSLVTVLFLNRDFYRFLARRRGWLFTAAAYGLHLLYFFNCGSSLFLGTAAHFFQQITDPAKKYSAARRPA
jgi:glycosyltransferase involved in cell wall biosynthesis